MKITWHFLWKRVAKAWTEPGLPKWPCNLESWAKQWGIWLGNPKGWQFAFSRQCIHDGFSIQWLPLAYMVIWGCHWIPNPLIASSITNQLGYCSHQVYYLWWFFQSLLAYLVNYFYKSTTSSFEFNL